MTMRYRAYAYTDEADRSRTLEEDVRHGLTASPKSLPPKYFYDRIGAKLFEDITRLPEYYLTRTEATLLEKLAPRLMRDLAPRDIVELGAGSAAKTRRLLDARNGLPGTVRYVPVDVDELTVQASAARLVADYPYLEVSALVGDFERHLSHVPHPVGRRLVLFLGSTIGNLDPARRARLLGAVASLLRDDDAFLLGVDLVKDEDRLVAAYNDSVGVTEAFVRNGLTVLNRELGADFDDERLEFKAYWDADNEWMDIGFVARSAQVVSIPELEVELRLEAGEPLRFEISAKFRRAGIEQELAAAGLRLTDWWTDPADDFAVLLATSSPTDS